MKNIFLLFGFYLLSSSFLSAQGINYTIDLNSKSSISQNLKSLAKAETDYWVSILKLDKKIAEKLRANNHSIYNQYVQIMKVYNYKMETVLLREQKLFKDRRDRFMKMMLSDADYKTFEKVVNKHATQDIKKYTRHIDEERRALRLGAAGWNVLKHTINFK
jgi:vacuolar-type H+-ATPase catalytic subunit A/Vma1